MQLVRYRNPEHDQLSPFSLALGTDEFTWLRTHPEQQVAFSSYMSCRREGKSNWLDLYPMDELCKDCMNGTDTVFLVDVGGNRGHDLLAFRARYPQIGGRLILQDQREVHQNLDLKEHGIEMMEYNFLTPQPVKGKTL